MSDFPRTKLVDSYIRSRRDFTKTDHQVWMEHAAQLELELDVARSRIRQLKHAGDLAIHEAVFGREDEAREIWTKAKEANP